MDAFRQRQVTCRTTLAPAVAKETNGRTLRAFHAPARGNAQESDATADKHRHSSLLKQQAPSVTYFNPLQRIQKMTSEALTDVDAERMVYPFHASAITTPFEQVLVALMDRLRSTVAAVSWNSPQPQPTWNTDLRFFGSWWLVLRTQEATGGPSQQSSADQHPSGRRSRISWVQGMHGEPLIPISTAALLRKFHDDKEENRYAPLLPRNAGTAEENQLVADLARRLAGPTDHLDIFHLSGLAMTPDRMHVLFFDGFSRLAARAARSGSADLSNDDDGGSEDEQSHLNSSSVTDALRDRSCISRSGEPSSRQTTTRSATAAAFFDEQDRSATLSTLSFSSCQIGSAALVVLLTGLATLVSQGMHSLCTLDLSYNALQSASLYGLTQLLRFTFVKRLSLRGNNLANVDVIPFREFLLEGCDRQMEELDLSYTELSAAQVGVLIEALPRLSRLRVLLLEEVTIPAGKWPSLARAVERTQLWHMRLVASNAAFTSVASIAAYIKSIDEVCARNARRAAEAGGAAAVSAAQTGFFGFSTTSFFEAFFRFAQLRAANAADGASALPGGYSAFTNNDPSLV